jgi:hypothetical protein
MSIPTGQLKFSTPLSHLVWLTPGTSLVRLSTMQLGSNRCPARLDRIQDTLSTLQPSIISVQRWLSQLFKTFVWLSKARVMICLVALMGMVASSCGCVTFVMVSTFNRISFLPPGAQTRSGRAAPSESMVRISSQTSTLRPNKTTSLSLAEVHRQSVQSVGGIQEEVSRALSWRRDTY